MSRTARKPPSATVAELLAGAGDGAGRKCHPIDGEVRVMPPGGTMREIALAPLTPAPVALPRGDAIGNRPEAPQRRGDVLSFACSAFSSTLPNIHDGTHFGHGDVT
jgi:hypothetical protein